jgi:anaerobic ribonucleoside-triphosphate reductase activating protein
MLKYHSSYIGFREIPDGITLCINISNCPNNCVGCHSPWLLKNEGIKLTYKEVKRLIKTNKGITCICFMGGDAEPAEIKRLSKSIRRDFPKLLIGWYSGKQELQEEYIDYLNFIKVGPYIKEKGPLDNPNTNQKFYMKYDAPNGVRMLLDFTNKFWK